MIINSTVAPDSANGPVNLQVDFSTQDSFSSFVRQIDTVARPYDTLGIKVSDGTIFVDWPPAGAPPAYYGKTVSIDVNTVVPGEYTLLYCRVRYVYSDGTTTDWKHTTVSPGGGGEEQNVVNHNFGSPDALRVFDNAMLPVSGATIIAYIANQYAAGQRIAIASAFTGPDGRWLQDMRLAPGTYTLTFDSPGKKQYVRSITVTEG